MTSIAVTFRGLNDAISPTPAIYYVDITNITNYKSLTIDDIAIQLNSVACAGGAPNASISYEYTPSTGRITMSSTAFYGYGLSHGITMNATIFILK